MESSFTNLEDFKSKLIANPDLQEHFKNDPVEAAKSISETPLYTDAWIYRIVVLALGCSIVLIIACVTLLAFSGKANGNVPAILTSIGSASIGALAGLLAPSPKLRR